MRWPEAHKLIERIREERPELTVDSHGSSTEGHFTLRLCCIKKGAAGDSALPYHLVPGSIDTIYGPEGWKRYKECHPEPWCRPEESYHTDALGREVDHQSQPVNREPPPAAPRISAEAMLERLVTLNHSDPDWWRQPAKVAEIAAIWGVRTRAYGVMTNCEPVEVARISGDCHASILIAPTGSGLFASSYLTSWGNGSTFMPPTVMSIPYDDEYQARAAVLGELISALGCGLGAAKHQQRQLLLAAVQERSEQRELF